MQLPENFIVKEIQSGFNAAYTGNISLDNVTGMSAGGAGDPETVIITDSLTAPTKLEIAYYIGLDGGASTINITSRGEESTTPQDWSAGDYVTQQVTHALLEKFVQTEGNFTVAGDITFTGTVTGSSGQYKLLTVGARVGTGSQAITGAGFEPKLVKINSVHDSGIQTDVSFGSATAAGSDIAITKTSGNWGRVTPAIVYLADGGTNDIATLTSIDSDGCTLNWTSRSVPGVTMQVEFYG